MDFYPLFADLRGQPCLVVGGGEVAVRKARQLAAAGARVTVNAVECCPAMHAMIAAQPGFRLHAGPFEPALVGEHVLVIAATSDATVNGAAAAAARAAARLCNVVDDGPASSFIVPSVVDRSPLVLAVSSGGRAPVLARFIRQRLEQWLPARTGALAEWAGRWRERVRERLPGMAQRREFWERLLTGAAAAAVLRGDEAGADGRAQALLDRPTDGDAQGKAWLVGAGPGDPGLISVHGLRILEQADVVLHDRLVAPQLLRAARREAEVVCVGKAGGAPSTSQEDINALLIKHVRAGHKVCRLKGGDPLIFGRGAEEALALTAAGLPFEIVPGISAASGCAAYASIPLTHRGVSASVTLLSAQRAPGAPCPDWARLAAPEHTLVVYMGGGRVAEIADALLTHGRAPGTPAAVIIDGTLPAQQVLTGTLADIAARCAVRRTPAPALLIIGETVALAGVLSRHRASGDAGSDDAECAPLPGPAALAG